MQFLQQLREHLASFNPGLPALVLVFVIWAPQAAIRKWFPALWAVPAAWGPQIEGLRQAWQALPSAMAGALITALSSHGDAWAAVWGVFVGVGAPALHHALRDSPLPYAGELSKPKPPTPGLTSLMLAITLGLSLVLPGCSPSATQVQRELATAVEHVSDEVVLPGLERAYEADGMLAVQAAKTAEEVDGRVLAWKRRWRPVWDCWDAFAAAHAAWLTALETDGAVLPTGAAARDAYCKLRVAAKDVGQSLPDFPGLGCKS